MKCRRQHAGGPEFSCTLRIPDGKARQAVGVTVETPFEFNVQVNFVDSDGKVQPTPLTELGE
jgi:hypothetical protein